MGLTAIPKIHALAAFIARAAMRFHLSSSGYTQGRDLALLRQLDHMPRRRVSDVAAR
jgi:hypothetical protein